jgi:uncharacterized protein (DUF433 family)
MAALSFAPAEVAALLDLPERQVRKEVEHGLFGTASPPRLSFAALVYLEVLRLIGLDLGVDDRKRLLGKIAHALTSERKPDVVDLTSVLSLRLGAVVDDVEARVGAFEHWRQKLVSNPKILGGEPVFPRSRLAVRQVGGMVERGESIATILADYPYLTEQDVKFAHIYARAYPRPGRPREPRQAPPR